MGKGIPLVALLSMSLAETPGGFCQLLSNPLTYYLLLYFILYFYQQKIHKIQDYEYTKFSAKASTLPKDSNLVKSAPSPVITTLTAINIVKLKINY